MATITQLKPVELTEAQKFLHDTAKAVAEMQHSKVIVISLNDEDETYHHAYYTWGISASQAVALLEISKATLIENMQ